MSAATVGSGSLSMIARLIGCTAVLALASFLAGSVHAGAADRNWAAPEIRAVTQAGVLGDSPSTFAPQAPLRQSELAAAIKATDALQHPPTPPAPPAPKPPPLMVVSTVGPGATITGVTTVTVDAPGQGIDHIDFALDGTGIFTEQSAPYEFALDTRSLADGTHQLAVNVSLAGGGAAIAVWSVTVANAPGAVTTAPGPPVAVPVLRSSVPAPAAPAVQEAPRLLLYRAASPALPVSIKQLDAALVGYLGLGDAARAIQVTLERAGLRPRPNTGTEAVARMLGLRLNHPAGQDDLELLPTQAATRAEAAWSFAQVLRQDDWATDNVRRAASAFALPVLTPWQRSILTTAISYVGYPYVWGGTSPTSETLFGVSSAGGFDCSGFVWRVYKLTPYGGERGLAGVLRGRTTYQMSGEVPHRELLPAVKLQPADVMFFGAHGRASRPSEVDHTALYLGNGWFVQSSGEGVTLLPFDGWYTHSFAWARRPLREAGLG
jgi:cell wall-associated NlpC family hydrolase